MREFSYEVDGQQKKITAERVGADLWLHMDGQTWVYQARTKRRQRSEGAAAHPGELRAPMPGKIIKIKFAEGEEVAEGNTVIVMEAMKMEYTLKAQQGGQLHQLSVKEGDQVKLGQLLAKVGET